MNKLRNLLYDKNDIFIALAIIAVAALIIIWRIDSIMEYPETLAAEGTTVQSETAKNDETETGDASSESNGDKLADGTYSYHSLYINPGDTSDTIAGYLVQFGYFETKEECIAAMEQAGATQKLQIGMHKIPKSATPAEAIQALTTLGE